MLTIKKPITSKMLIIAAAVLSIFITYTYSSSMTLFYGVTEILLAAVCYFLVFKNLKAPDGLTLIVFVALTAISFINGVFYNDLRSVLLLSLSLVLPLAISVLNVDFSDDGIEFVWGFVIGFIIIILQSTTAILGNINSNTFGFYCYMATSIGFVWYKMSKVKILPLVFILISVLFSIQSGSRNVAIVALLVLILVMLPGKLFENKSILRTLYIIALLYTIFASDIMEWIFAQERLAMWLKEYSEKVSDKAWDMEERIVFLREVRRKIRNMDLIPQLFGEGILRHHGHNMLYQSIYVYGYVGTALLYAMYIRIFEMACTLIHKNKDKIAMGCFLGLIGVFLLNGGDIFLIGIEACAIIPQLLLGIIMMRYLKWKKSCNETLSLEAL